MPTWPETLPDHPLKDELSEEPPDVLLRTGMDAGPAKVRRRFTAGVRPFAVKLRLTADQAADLDEFYVTTLQGGALRFDWVHPRTGDAAEFRFASRPKYAPGNGNSWSAAFGLELMP